jgi:hypothetical protein
MFLSDNEALMRPKTTVVGEHVSVAERHVATCAETPENRCESFIAD